MRPSPDLDESIPPRWWSLPAPCGICGGWACPAGLCRPCIDRFALPAPRCRRCALRVPPGVVECGDCLRAPPLFAQASAAVDYGFPWDRAIAAFKFRADLAWAMPLARLLARAAAGATASVDLVTAVPLSQARLRERGYNQAWEIARRAARLHRLPARHDLLRRLRDTPAQANLDRRQRDANLRGAFMPGDASARAALRGRCVALVDDVLTTGSTCNEAARALLEAGARAVQVWVIARTPHDPD
jgi:ComF family protein